MVEISAAVEDHFADALLFGLLCDALADGLGRGQVAARSLLALFAQIGAGREQSLALHVVNELHVDMVERAVNVQARPLSGARHLFADALVNAQPDFILRSLWDHLLAPSCRLLAASYFAPVLPTFFFRRSPS